MGHTDDQGCMGLWDQVRSAADLVNMPIKNLRILDRTSLDPTFQCWRGMGQKEGAERGCGDEDHPSKFAVGWTNQAPPDMQTSTNTSQS